MHPAIEKGVLFGIGLVLLLAAAPVASADSASISVTSTSGQSDPAAGVPRVFTVSGDASVPEQVFVKFRAPGGAPCAPSAASDTGSTFGEPLEPTLAYGDYVNGAFSLQQVYTWEPAGTFMFCIWLPRSHPYEDADEQIVQPITQMITFRSPTGTISGTVVPTAPNVGEVATLTVAGASESPEYVFAKLRSVGGAPCAPTFESDSGTSLIDGEQVNGSFDVKATVTQSTAGSYLICLWLASSSNATPPLAGPQSVLFTVGKPASSPHRVVKPSHACLRDRAQVADQSSAIRFDEALLRGGHLSHKSRRTLHRAVGRARHQLAHYHALSRLQCPHGR